mmetsp:Transcript_12109/g.55025  ORF Transcript_12109/g.55025 Transcript_12109/m.55025 type:complete len:418 (-) Transcript_12109:204-1457(-)
MPRPQTLGQVAEHDEPRDGYPARVRVQRVVPQLGQHVHRAVPPVHHPQSHRADPRLDAHALLGIQLVDSFHRRLKLWVEKGARHAVDPHVPVQPRAEEPLVHRVHVRLLRVGVLEQTLERPEHSCEHPGYLPQHVNDDPAHREFSQHRVDVGVLVFADVKGEIHRQREQRVHRAYVVQHVVVSHGEAYEEHEEVEPPHHLREPVKGKVFPHVVVGKIAKSRHPHVRRDEHPDGVVNLRSLEVVVQQEQHLHPPFPLLRLFAVQRDVGPALFRSGEPAVRAERREDGPEQIPVVMLLGFRHRGASIGEPEEREDAPELSPRAECIARCDERAPVAEEAPHRGELGDVFVDSDDRLDRRGVPAAGRRHGLRAAGLNVHDRRLVLLRRAHGPELHLSRRERAVAFGHHRHPVAALEVLIG